MNRIQKSLCIFLVLFLTALTPSFSQDGNNAEGGGDGPEKTETGKAARRKAKKEWKKQRKQEMSDAKAKKQYNKKHNSKKTRKRMKKNEKKAKRHNEHKKEFFITRWFKKKRK